MQKETYLTKGFIKGIVVMVITCILTNLILPTTLVFASESNTINEEELEKVTNQIVQYSEYDSSTGTWILNHQIVEDGVFTEKQYQDAETAGKEWGKVEKNLNKKQTRALPALLVLAIKAVGVIAGTTAVTTITDHFLKWGFKSGCNKFKGYSAIKSFCKANGYL